MRLIVLSFLSIFIGAYSFGQVTAQIGAHSLGLANTSVVLKNVYAVKNNPGLFAFQNNTEIGIQYLNRFFTNELSSQTICLGGKTKIGNIGAFVQQSGFSLFRQIQIGGTYGLQLTNKFGLGINLNYHSTQFGDIYGQKSNLSAGIGLFYKFSDKISFGANIINLTRSSFNENEFLPTVFTFGAKYDLSEASTWYIELEKEASTPLNIKSSIELLKTEVFNLRFGINSYPFQSAFGIGLKFKSLKIDIASIWHAQIGLSPSFGITYEFNEK